MDTEATNQKSRKQIQLLQKWRFFLSLVAIVLVYYLIAAYTGFYQTLEYKTHDFFFSVRNTLIEPDPPEDIVIVAIDELSMQEMQQQWPWSRRIHGDLVKSMHEAGAAVLAFDVVFAEFSSEAEADDYFAEAMTQAGNVILAEDRDTIAEAAYQLSTPVLPLPMFEMSANTTGLIWMSLDIDGYLRRLEFVQTDAVPFALVIAEAYRQRNGGVVDLNDPVTTFNIPHELTTPIIINYLGTPRTIKTVSYYQALDYKRWLGEDYFKNKIVMVGFNLVAPADVKMADHFQFPLVNDANIQLPGVEAHATVVDSLLRERYLQNASLTVEWVFFLVFLIIGVLILWYFSHWIGAIIFLGLMFTFVIAKFILFYNFDYVSYLVTPLSALLVMLISERVYGYAVVDQEKRFIRKAFSHYISPVIVDQLIDDPEKLNLSGQTYDASILFTDLVGFTSLSETMEPMRLQQLLTEYFGEMMQPVKQQNGTLDKFIGDAVMCFFGIPIATPDHANQAVHAAWGMSMQLQMLNSRWALSNLPSLAMRIGINSGQVVAGNMGTTDIFNYTVMGDNVNLAARLEGVNKQYGTDIIIGESTFKAMDGTFGTRMLDKIRVKGKQEAVTIYELLGPVSAVSDIKLEQVSTYEQAFEMYIQQEFHKAIKIFDQVLAIAPDKASYIMKDRCNSYIDASPGKEWDGVFTMTTK